MYRSGTTLVEQMLSVSNDVHSAGELQNWMASTRAATGAHMVDPLDPRYLSRLGEMPHRKIGQNYVDGTEWRLQGAKFVTDKLPSNFLAIDSIMKGLGNAKVLHMRRNPLETSFSSLREVYAGKSNGFSYNQLELADYYVAYDRLMREFSHRYSDRIMDVEYAQLVEAPSETMQRISDFLGVGFRDEMADPRNSRRPVSTASSVEVRSTVSARKVAKYVPYIAHLGPLRERLSREGVINT